MADIYSQINTKLSKLFPELPDDCKVKTADPRNLWNKDLRDRQAVLLGDIAMLERRTDKLSEEIINGQ